nr:hypothetical protein [uncultured Methylotenera sp.]
MIATTSQAAITTDVVCSFAPSQNAAINRIASGVGGAGAGAAAILQSVGMTAVTHSSGAYILTGSGGYVAGTLGGAVVAPALMTASVIVGGAAVVVELSCAPVNHPEAIKSVKKFGSEFNKALVAANERAIDIRDSTGKSIRNANDKAMSIRDAGIKKISSVNDEAIEFRDSASRLIAKGTLLK